ncbi:hypothetical protein GIB67_027701, partial [Kingdonia uniflora]
VTFDPYLAKRNGSTAITLRTHYRGLFRCFNVMEAYKPMRGIETVASLEEFLKITESTLLSLCDNVPVHFPTKIQKQRTNSAVKKSFRPADSIGGNGSGDDEGDDEDQMYRGHDICVSCFCGTPAQFSGIEERDYSSTICHRQSASTMVEWGELLEDARQNRHVLSTGCEGIDLLLQGGLREAQVMELVGPSSSGKTQAEHKSHERAMRRKLCHSEFDIFGLFDVLRQLESKLRSQINRGDGRLRLLVIDSISSLITPILGSRGEHGHSLMISAGFLLKKLAYEHNLSVLVQHLIEKYLIFHMTKEECMEALSKHANMKPVITSTVWKELEKENKEFFDNYKRNRQDRMSESQTTQMIQNMISNF